MAVKIDSMKCNGCGRCEVACPMDAIKVKNGKAVVSEDSCAECGACVSACPQGAISQ
jgi:NAD-dependent dihydropyrimidine dehydrogenase PreA subunit